MHAVPLLLLLSVLFMPLIACAQRKDEPRKIAVGHVISVVLELNQPTQITLPETVDSGAVAAFKEHLEIESNGPHFTMVPRVADTKGRLFLYGESGESYQVEWVVAPRGADAKVLVQTSKTVQGAASAPPEFGVTSLMRTLLTKASVPGERPVELASPGNIDSRLVVEAQRMTAVGRYLGLMALVRNVSHEPVSLDDRVGAPNPRPNTIVLGTWIWGPMVELEMITLTDLVLQPGQATQLYAVFREMR